MKPAKLLLLLFCASAIWLMSCSKSDKSTPPLPSQVVDTNTTDFRDSFCGEFRVHIARETIEYSVRTIKVYDTTILVGYTSPTDSFKYFGPLDTKIPAIRFYFRNSNKILTQYWHLGILKDGKLATYMGFSKGGFLGTDSINTILNYTSNHYFLNDTITGYRIK